MLRHACGFKLANDGHDTRAIQAYLGHRSIMSTIRYTVLDGEPVQELLERLGGAAQSEAKTASPQQVD
jgi:site-specific recombinase XerD